MEFGLHEDLPIYAGGLGVLAGDHLKSAGDAKVPLVGIGLLWGEGYTRQRIEGGEVVDHFIPFPHPFADTGKRIHVRVFDKNVEVSIFVVENYGNAPLYLLEPTHVDDRWITKRLYGGGPFDRVAQEILLGIGGVRALRALEKEIDVYHFNEGHAVLAGVELIRERMVQSEVGTADDRFRGALHAVRDQIVFTTHTPVEAGNEQHPYATLEEVGAFNGMSHDQMEMLGGPHSFNMTVAGLHLCRAANAVSRLHGEVAREMWKWVDSAPEITHVTNGVHVPTWQDDAIRVIGNTGSDEDLRSAKASLKRALCAEIQARTGVQFHEAPLTIGFARRATAYKRPDLIFHDPARIEALLAAGRVQLIFSGKAHPADGRGKMIVKHLYRLSQQYAGKVVFLEDYDLHLGRVLTRGCDVWLNNPRRPLEASGTSGMKAALNGVLNFSVSDGWWDEAAIHGENVGIIGDRGHFDDDRDARDLYEVLENQVLPIYEKDRPRWLRMMRASIAMAESGFSSARMLSEYYSKIYETERISEAVSANAG